MKTTTKGGTMSNWERAISLANRYLRVRVVLHGIPANDMEDIRQNIVLHILKHQKSLSALSKRRLNDSVDRTVARYTKRWRRYRTRYGALELTPIINETRQGEFSEHGFTALRLDVAALLEKLTARQRVICQCLIHDKLPRQIQKMAHCSQSTLTRELDKIRQRFQRFGYC